MRHAALSSELKLPFTHSGVAGAVTAVCEPNDHPASLGCAGGARDLPFLRATIASKLSGYDAMLGWVQLVRSTDNASNGAEFEMDPFSLFAEIESPYCFYGHLPTLFDGPSRASREDMSWIAHSFLAVSPVRPVARSVRPLVGFSWGFDIRAQQITFLPPTALTESDWRDHLPVLRAAYPSWNFAEDGLQG
jgi:hypothetical protein